MTERQAKRYFEKARWPNGPICPHCSNGKRVYELSQHRPGLYNCALCRKQFTVTIGTVMQSSHIPVPKWLMAFPLVYSAKKGISTLQLQRNLDLRSYTTAWRILKQIRTAMSNIEHGKTFGAIVEIDETYIDGKPKKSNRKDDDKHHKRGRGTKKNRIVSVVERNKRRVVYANLSLEGKKLPGNQLSGILNEVCN